MKTDKEYDYLIVGSGLFGATFAHEAMKRGQKCLVIDKRNHVGGNVYCENVEGINVFIPLIRVYGIMLMLLYHLIGIQILR